MGLLQKLTGQRDRPTGEEGAAASFAPKPQQPANPHTQNSGQRANGGWFALFAGKMLDASQPAPGPLPDLSEALRTHRRKTRHEWLDSAPVQNEVLESFNGVFDETMTDGLGLADATGPETLLAGDPSDLSPSVGAETTELPPQTDEEEMPDGFTMLFRAHG